LVISNRNLRDKHHRHSRKCDDNKQIEEKIAAHNLIIKNFRFKTLENNTNYIWQHTYHIFFSANSPCKGASNGNFAQLIQG
jgi:hypothetical protein